MITSDARKYGCLGTVWRSRWMTAKLLGNHAFCPPRVIKFVPLPPPPANVYCNVLAIERHNRDKSKESPRYIVISMDTIIFSKVLCLFIATRVTYFRTWGDLVQIRASYNRVIPLTSSQDNKSSITRPPTGMDNQKTYRDTQNIYMLHKVKYLEHSVNTWTGVCVFCS
jgi:hypothetical protein